VTTEHGHIDLLGRGLRDVPEIINWMSYFNTEVMPCLRQEQRFHSRGQQHDWDRHASFYNNIQEAIEVVEAHLRNQRSHFLVCDQLTLADLFCAGILSLGFEHFFDLAWRERHPYVCRWYLSVCLEPIYAAVAEELQPLN
jgi:pseurotin biosynthesis glutathione S-transferase